MATKTKDKTDTPLPAELQRKVDDYAAAYGVAADAVIVLALRDFFYNVESGKRPRSNSEVEPVVG